MKIMKLALVDDIMEDARNSDSDNYSTVKLAVLREILTKHLKPIIAKEVAVQEALEKLPQLNDSHYIDIIVRRNGKNERYEGDWIKVLKGKFNE